MEFGLQSDICNVRETISHICMVNHPCELEVLTEGGKTILWFPGGVPAQEYLRNHPYSGGCGDPILDRMAFKTKCRDKDGVEVHVLTII